MHAISRKTAILLVATASALAVGTSMAVAKETPTCQALEDQCVKHVETIAARQPEADGIERPHMTRNECYDSYHAAESTGIWPAHIPFNFATSCTK